MTSDIAPRERRVRVGLFELSWHWAGSVDGPRLKGFIEGGDDNWPFELTPQSPQKTVWLLLQATTQILSLALRQEDQQWSFSASTLVGVPEYRELALHHWQMGRRNQPDSGVAQLPLPWQGRWALLGAQSTQIRVQLSAGEMVLPNATLGAGTPAWSTNLAQPLSRWECALSLDIRADNSCYCQVRLPVLSGELRTQVLDRWSGSKPLLPGDSREQKQSRLTGLAPFRQLGFMTLMVPPTVGVPRQRQAGLLFTCDNLSDYYKALLQADGLLQLQQLGNAFIAGQVPYQGQYVRDLTALPAPWWALGTAAAGAVLERPFDTRAALSAALTELFGIAPQELLALTDFAVQQARLENSYLSLLLLDYSQAEQGAALVAALRVLALLQWVLEPCMELDDAKQIGVAQRARPELDQRLFPLPQGSSMHAPPGVLLGAGRLYEFAERIEGYALGPIAEAVNLLPGEQLGQRHNQQTRLSEREQDQQNWHSQQQHNAQGQQSARSQPLLASRTQFNDVAENYGADGLSLSISGNYVIEPGQTQGTDFQPAQQARSEAQGLLEQALSQLHARVSSGRERLLRASWESSQWQKLENPGELPRRGFYHWLREQREARLRDLGPRLLLHWTLDAPAEVLLKRVNARRGQRWAIPPAPWESWLGEPGVGSPGELTLDNYPALAQRYGLSPLLPAPLAEISLSQVISATPAMSRGTLSIPQGYLSQSLDYAAQPNSSGYLMIAGRQLDLTTALRVDLPGISGELPFTVEGATSGVALSLRLTCCERRYHLRLANWQIQAYEQLQQGYRQATAELCRELSRVFDASQGGLCDTLISLLYAAILQAMQSHYPDTGSLALQRAQQLQPWLRQALPWQQAVMAYATADQPQDWLPLRGSSEQLEQWPCLLHAAQLRVSLPLDHACASRLFYLLRSGGRLWLGREDETPVFAEDADLYRQWMSLKDQPLAAEQRWQFSMETWHRYLADDLELQASCPEH